MENPLRRVDPELEKKKLILKHKSLRRKKIDELSTKYIEATLQVEQWGLVMGELVARGIYGQDRRTRAH